MNLLILTAYLLDNVLGILRRSYMTIVSGSYHAYISIFLTPVRAVGTFYTTINSIGPFQLAIHVVQNHRAGEEKSQWNKTTNKGKYHLKILNAILFVLSQCDICTPAWPFCITWMASSKEPIQSHKPVLALLLVFPHEAYISKPFQRQWKFWTALRFKYLII